MDEEAGSKDNDTDAIPLHVDGHVIYLASSVIRPGTSSDEVEVASRPASLDDALAGLSAFATKVGDSLRDAGPTRLTVEFSCEFAVEAGKFVAIVGKASAKSGVKVGLELTGLRCRQERLGRMRTAQATTRMPPRPEAPLLRATVEQTAVPQPGCRPRCSWRAVPAQDESLGQPLLAPPPVPGMGVRRRR